MNKLCKLCNTEKDIIFFNIDNSKPDGYNPNCKECRKIWRKRNKDKISEYNKEYMISNKDYFKDYYKDNKEEISKYKSLYRSENKDSISLYNEKYREDNKEEISKYQSLYRSENKDYYVKYREENIENIRLREKEYYILNRDRKNNYINKYNRDRKDIDNLFKISCNLRSYISNSLKCKNKKTEHILGISFDEFKNYLESKFEYWMNWENYGRYNGTIEFGWDIDHIIPLSSAKTEEDLYKLFYYTNLQPLCSKTNRYIKRDIIA